MRHLILLSAGIVALASLSPSAASAQTLTLHSRNTVTADPTVPRPPSKPCVVDLFDGVAFDDFSAKSFPYAPPAACRGPWSEVVLEADWSVTAGVQFDRTAAMWIGGVNVYFGTTAEPSGEVARSWHVERDLTAYASLFTSPQTGRTDLGNLVNTTYTGVLYGSARLVFYPGPVTFGQNGGDFGATPRPADLVIPLAADPTGGAVSVTGGSPLSQTVTLPQNVERAVLDVVAQSQASDEFWYACVPSDVADTLQSCGGTAFRETEVSLDGQPAGVAPVYPWIYTGGIDPFLWQPMPGVQTLDFEPYRVELSPFAGSLSDGKPHTLSLDVFSANDHFSTTATLLVWLDHSTAQITGGVTQNTLAAAPTPQVSEALTTAPDGSITGTVGVSSARAFTIQGWIQTSHGMVETGVTQQILFQNEQSFVISASVYDQAITQATTIASETFTFGPWGETTQTRNERWPLSLAISFVQAADGSATQTTTVTQELTRDGQAHYGTQLVGLEHLDVWAEPADTLTFDSMGNFTGNTGQVSWNRYFSYAIGACYSRDLSAVGGALTSVKTGTECTPNRP